MAVEPIRYRNRYSGRIETESVYGERWLRWAYGSFLGRLSVRAVAARPFFSRWYGWRMDRPASQRKVLPFVREFGIDAAEFAEPPEAYRTFNEFFFRRLRPDARPIHSDPRSVVFPADGRHLGFANLAAADRFFIKGQRFNLADFIADDAVLRRFEGGPAVFSRLCPVDYHRFHFPLAGVPTAPRLINGGLRSVNPIALRQRLAFLWENRRWRTELETDLVGGVLMFEIGATNVGSAEFTFTPGRSVAKGQEKGFFRFGGSAVLTLFEPGHITLAEDLLGAANEGLELYAHVGDVMGWAPIHSLPAGAKVGDLGSLS